MRSHRRGQRGFTFLEIQIVVSTIAILFTLAVPSFFPARKAANETKVIDAMRRLNTAQLLYLDRSVGGDFTGSFSALIKEQLLFGADVALSTGKYLGYKWTLTRTASGSWEAIAVPIKPGVTGCRSFYIGSDGIIRFVTKGKPKASSPPVFSRGAEDSPPANVTKASRTALALIRKLDGFGEDKGVVVESAREFLSDPDNVDKVLAALDANMDGELSFDEIFSNEHLELSRLVKTELDPDETSPAGEDAELLAILDAHGRKLSKQLHLDCCELPLPTVAIESLTGDPVEFFD